MDQQEFARRVHGEQTRFYRMMIPDDSAFGVVVVLNEGWSCEVSEYTDPGGLMLDFSQSEDPDGTVYYLRSEAMAYGEEPGLLCETFHTEGATQLKTKSGEYLVTLGQYESQEEAEAALQQLNARYGDQGLFVASGEAGEIPEN